MHSTSNAMSAEYILGHDVMDENSTQAAEDPPRLQTKWPE